MFILTPDREHDENKNDNYVVFVFDNETTKCSRLNSDKWAVF